MMMRKNAKRLVIDASVARASGGEGAEFPASKHCRDLLKTALDVCHHVVMSPDIRDEWKKHQSSFARDWLVTMNARKKVDYQATPPKNEKLKQKIKKASANPREIKSMMKDFHLIDGAVLTDKVIISLDDSVRKSFSSVALQVGELRPIAWINPAEFGNHSIKWLQKGAKPEKRFCLGSQAINP